jgi:hypothetical protein
MASASRTKIGFYLDGHYHNLFTIKRWPQKTYPASFTG